MIGRHLDLPVVSIAPEDAGEHFGWLARFLAVDSPASSALTRELLGLAADAARAHRRPRRGPLLRATARPRPAGARVRHCAHGGRSRPRARPAARLPRPTARREVAARLAGAAWSAGTDSRPAAAEALADRRQQVILRLAREPAPLAEPTGQTRRSPSPVGAARAAASPSVFPADDDPAVSPGQRQRRRLRFDRAALARGETPPGVDRHHDGGPPPGSDDLPRDQHGARPDPRCPELCRRLSSASSSSRSAPWSRK